MPFVIAENPSAAVCTVEAVQENPVHRLMQRVFEEQRVHISEIAVGSTRYPLRRHLVGTYTRAFHELAVERVSPVITGRGETPEESRHDFCVKVHAAFQELLHKRSFEMSENDKLVWDTLNEIIDVVVYRNTTPIVVRQFGRICRARPYPLKVEWEDGRTETVTAEQVENPDYVTYKPGQPFMAVVHRDPLTSRLIRIVDISRRPEPRRLPSDKEKALLDSIGSSKQLESDPQWRP